jgi:hypothetical protein
MATLEMMEKHDTHSIGNSRRTSHDMEPNRGANRKQGNVGDKLGHYKAAFNDRNFAAGVDLRMNRETGKLSCVLQVIVQDRLY